MTNVSLAHAGVRGLSAWAPRYDVLFCDVWGVVHDGEKAIPEAADALARFRDHGGTVILITNAPRPKGSIVGLLDRFGVPRNAYDTLVSSGDVTVEMIVERGDAPVHHLGPPRDNPLFEEAALRGATPPRVGVADASYVVCSGLFDDADGLDAYNETLARMKARALPFICANPDIVVHTGDRLVFCAGALAERYAAIGGPVTMIGKPHPRIYRTVRAEAQRLRGAPIRNERILAIGDGMFTDIVGARDEGLESILITSGIHRDRVRVTGPDGRFTVEPAAYAELAREAGATPTGHMAVLEW